MTRLHPTSLSSGALTSPVNAPCASSWTSCPLTETRPPQGLVQRLQGGEYRRPLGHGDLSGSSRAAPWRARAIRPASCAASNCRRRAAGATTSSSRVHRVDARQCLALEQLERGAAARRHVIVTIGEARLLHRRDAVAAADDGEARRSRRPRSRPRACRPRTARARTGPSGRSRTVRAPARSRAGRPRPCPGRCPAPSQPRGSRDAGRALSASRLRATTTSSGSSSFSPASAQCIRARERELALLVLVPIADLDAVAPRGRCWPWRRRSGARRRARAALEHAHLVADLGAAQHRDERLRGRVGRRAEQPRALSP